MNTASTDRPLPSDAHHRVRDALRGCDDALIREVVTSLRGYVADIGAGPGSSLDPGSSVPITDLAERVVAVDLRPRATARWGVCANFDQPLPLGTASFTAVVCNHVLEHLEQPRRLAAELSRILVPRGILITCVPNGRSVSDRLFRLKYGLQHDAKSPEYDPHRQKFTRRTFAGLLEQAGFECLYLETIEEGYSWLFKHPRVRRLATAATRSLRRIGPEAFSYGWFCIARNSTGPTSVRATR